MNKSKLTLHRPIASGGLRHRCTVSPESPRALDDPRLAALRVPGMRRTTSAVPGYHGAYFAGGQSSARPLSVHPNSTATATATAGHHLPNRLHSSLRSGAHPSHGRVLRTRLRAPPRRLANQQLSIHTSHSPGIVPARPSKSWGTERARGARREVPRKANGEAVSGVGEARPRKHRREGAQRLPEARSAGRASIAHEGFRGRRYCGRSFAKRDASESFRGRVHTDRYRLDSQPTKNHVTKEVFTK